jgi:hypothetical protein
MFPNVPLRSLACLDRQQKSPNIALLQGISEALFRTRTGDPLLTMEIRRRDGRVSASR